MLSCSWRPTGPTSGIYCTDMDFFLQMNTVTKVLCGGVDEGAKGDNEQTFHG